jgi:hypothetical protein
MFTLCVEFIHAKTTRNDGLTTNFAWFFNFHFNINIMKKLKFSLIAIAAAITMQSCVGSFAMTRKWWDWNNSSSRNKFVNLLIYWVLGYPVTGCTMFIDGVILNTIEFWSGSNPMANADMLLEGQRGTYRVKSNASGYDIEMLGTGERAQFLYDQANGTWSLAQNGMVMPLLRYDSNGIAQVIAQQPSLALAAK